MLRRMEQRGVRQLAAIMFADIEGYTALMQRSEAEAMEWRRRFRDALARSLEHYRGEAVQHYGDGTLSVFRSAVDATSCALEVQVAMRSDPPVPLRIGIHLGDIVRDQEGVYGDGVNIAARVQALAPSGAVLLTDRVAEQVKNHRHVALADLGTHRLKNVERPVMVFAVADDRLETPDRDSFDPAAASSHSVAVLPFASMSGDPDNEYFCDGITEEIINSLAQLPDLKVTSRTSSFAFKGRNIDVREIAGTLDVRYVLEGSVRRSGRRIRVTAQLIDAASGFHEYSKTWDREIEDVFAIQDEIAEAIARHTADAFVETGGEEVSRIHSHSVTTPEAYAAYLHGLHEWNKWSPESALRAVRLYRNALELDPGLAAAHAGTATAYAFLGILGRVPPSDAHLQAMTAASRALGIDPDSSEAEVTLGLTALFFEWNAERAESHFARALRLSPGSAVVHHYHGMYHGILGHHGLALAALQTALELDPLNPPINSDYANALLRAGQHEEALRQIRHTQDIAPQFRAAVEVEGIIHWMMGDLERAEAAIHRYRELSPSPFAGASFLGYMRARSGDMPGALEQHQRLEERERVEPGTALDMDFAMLYVGMRKYEWALGRLEKAVDSRAAMVVFVGWNPAWAELADHPRFKAIKRRIGLWD